MEHEGPALETLLRRMAETPRDFLDTPRVANTGELHVAALVFDLSHLAGDALAELQMFALASKADSNWLSLCAVACWLLSDPGLLAHVHKPALLHLLGETLRAVALEYRAEKYVLEPERREELVRLALADLGLRPAGETLAQAQDRLQALSATERRRVLTAAKETERRAREIREALIQKAAAEAADKYTRE